MTFTTKKVSTETLGEYLLARRSHSGLSLEEAATLAQIQSKYLLALEEGRFADLPACVYIRGFLKSLAKIYHVDEIKLLSQFQAEHEIADNLQLLNPGSKKIKFFLPRFILSPKTLTLFAVLLVGAASLAYLYFQVISLNRPPFLEVISPDPERTVNSSLLVVRGKTEARANVYFNNQAIVVDANGEFQENLSLAPGANQLVIKAVNKFGQETIVRRSIILQEKEIAGSFIPEEAPLEGPVITQGGLPLTGLALEVQVGPDAAWIYLESDGVEKYSGTMLPGTKQQITAKDKIMLTTGNAGSTRVFLNGKDLGILGKEGEVIRDIEFTK